jgi:hypothetical protein
MQQNILFAFVATYIVLDWDYPAFKGLHLIYCNDYHHLTVVISLNRSGMYM